MGDTDSANQPRTDLKSSSEYSMVIVHSESENGCFADKCAWQDGPRFMMENEMQVSTQ